MTDRPAILITGATDGLGRALAAPLAPGGPGSWPLGQPPLLRRNERFWPAGPCAPWILPVSWPPRPRPVPASLARLRSSASRNLRLASSSALAASPGLVLPAGPAPLW